MSYVEYLKACCKWAFVPACLLDLFQEVCMEGAPNQGQTRKKKTHINEPHLRAKREWCDPAAAGHKEHKTYKYATKRQTINKNAQLFDRIFPL